MNIYIDESGSINNHSPSNEYFVIAMVLVLDKNGLSRAYKRFISSNYQTLQLLDKEKIDNETKKVLKAGNKMFINGNFKELKGSQFDRELKLKFLEFFSREHYFDVYYIKISNKELTDKFASNTSRVFNYAIKSAIDYFLKNNLLPNENCHLQLDERNEKVKSRYFLENYLNTELAYNEDVIGNFTVTYFDSSNNRFVQIADVFANLYYSELQTNQFTEQFAELKEKNILKHIFEFPNNF